MADYIVGGAAVVIKPIFTGFRTTIQKEFNTVLSSEATKAGNIAGNNMADAVGKQGSKAGEKFTDGLGKEIKGNKAEASKAAKSLADGMEKPFDKAGRDSGSSFASGLKKAMGPIAGIIAGIGIADQIKDTITKASDGEQSLGATEAIFKQHAGKVVGYSKDAAEKYGLSANTYRESSNLLGALFKNQGVDIDKLAGKTDQMVGIGADLAAQFGGTSADAVASLSAAFKGEYDSLDKYGITMNQTMVNDELKRRGQDKLTGSALALATQTAKTDMIIASSADAAGAAAREADTFAGSQARLIAKVDNLKESVGKPLTDALAASFGFIANTVLPALEAFGGWLNANKLPLAIFGGALAAIAIGANASAIGMSIATTATNIWAGAMRVFNAVMNMNPIMKIVGLIGLLVAGVIYAYKNFEGFRTVVDGAWTGIKNAALFAWNKVLKPTFAAIGNFLRNVVGPAFKWLYNSVIKPVWEGIKTAIGVVVTAVKGYINAWVSLFKNVLAPAFRWILNTIIKPVMTAIKGGISGMWTAVKGVFKSMGTYVRTTLARAFTWFRDSVIKPIWNGIKNTISDVWNNKIKPVFTALGTFIRDKVAPVFKKGVDKIKGIWETIKGFAKKPISFVIDTVINKGLIGAFNKVAGWIPGVKELGPVSIPGFARGGYTGKGRKYQEAGVVHKDEFVLRKEATNRLRKTIGLGGLDHMNKTGLMPGYAKGGLVNPMAPNNRGVSAGWHGYPGHKGTDYPAPVGTQVYSPGDGTVARTGWNLPGGTGKQVWINHDNGLLSRVHHLSEWLVNAGQRVTAGQPIGRVGMTGNTTGPHAHWGVMDGSQYLNPASVWGSGKGGSGGGGGGGFDPLSAFTGLGEKVSNWISEKFPGGGQMVEMAKGIGGKLIGDVKQWASDKLSGIGDFTSDVIRNISGNSPKQQVRGVAEHYGWSKGNQWASLNELIRRESGWDPNAANPNSSARGLFQKMTSLHGAIEGTADGQAKWGLNYIKERYGDPQNAINHWDKYGSYANGGLVNGADHRGLYDNGGWLNPGLTAAMNLSGKPEAILTADQWKSVSSIVDRTTSGYGNTEINVSVPNPGATGADIADKLYFETRRNQRGGRK